MINIAVFKTVGVKNNASEWFDGEFSDKIDTLNNQYKKIKLMKLHLNEETHREIQIAVQNVIRKRRIFREKVKRKYCKF